MSYVDGFLNMTLGAAPLTLVSWIPTPEGLLRRCAVLALDRKAEYSAAAAGRRGHACSLRANCHPSDKHELFVMVGVAGAPGTASGGYTKAQYGHTDSGDGNWNRGTVSGRGTSLTANG